MRRKVQVTFRISPDILAELDELVKGRYFYNRSHALEVALSLLLSTMKVAKGPIIGVDEELLQKIMSGEFLKDEKSVEDKEGWRRVEEEAEKG